MKGLPAAFPVDEYYLSQDAVLDALARRTQFNIIHADSGLKVDILVPEGTVFDDGRFRGPRAY